MPKLHRGGEGRGRWLWLGQRRPGDGDGDGVSTHEFHGYDSSDVAIRLAKENRAASGLDDVIFHRAPASALEPNGSFDFVLTAELLLRGTPLKDGRTTLQTDDASRHANAGR